LILATRLCEKLLGEKGTANVEQNEYRIEKRYIRRWDNPNIIHTSNEPTITEESRRKMIMSIGA